MSKGKQPRTRVNKVPKFLLSEIKAVFIPNGQAIGLEAVICWRARSRALVLYKYFMDNGTENLTDLNKIPKPCPYILMYILDIVYMG